MKSDRPQATAEESIDDSSPAFFAYAIFENWRNIDWKLIMLESKYLIRE